MLYKVTLVVALVLGTAIVGLAASGPPGGAATDVVCQEELGPEWVSSGVAKHPDWDRYHVQCERSTGLLSHERKWVTIRPSEFPERIDDPPPI